MTSRLPCLLPLLLAAAPLAAQPTDGRITAGTGTVVTAGTLTQVDQASDRLIIDWNSFSIPAGTTVNFTQPGAWAAVLNRVTGGDPSAILGTLSANGQVYLLNPNGILVGATGRVETAGFLASTARLANSDFLRGTDLGLTGGTDAAVVNQGRIAVRGGDLLLVARRVVNAGTLAAPDGTAQLVGATEVLLAAPGSPALISAGSAPGEVENSAAGAIAAAQVRLEAVGGNAAALAINQAGVIRATGIANRGGEVWLVATGAGRTVQQGEIIARDADGSGGAIRATGGQLLVAAGSQTDASGAAGGGVVELGGAVRGTPLAANAGNARETVVEAGAQITADAQVAGDGGRVVLWGGESLGFYGTVSAGGAAGGRGGFVETSGAWLDLFGAISTGLDGQWLIDPYNIRIVDGPSVGFSFSGTNPVVGRPASSESRLDVRLLEQALASQGKVVIDTGGPGNDVGNIIIDTPIFYQDAGYARLTLNAANDIYVNRTITAAAGAGALDLDFNADIDANGQGKVILGADLFTRGGTVIFQEDVITTGNADLSILSGGGDIVFAGDLRLGNLNGLDLSSQGGDILMASLSASTQVNAILRLTDLGPRNLYTSIAALLANPVPTPAATLGTENGRLVKRRSLRRVNNPPGFQTVAWMGFKQGAGEAPGSLVSAGNFGPTRPPAGFDDSYMDFPARPPAGNQNGNSGNSGRPPVDDSYLDAPFVNRPPTGKPPTDDSYMDVTVPNTPFWAQNNPPGGTAKPPIDDSYMDFPWRPQGGGTGQTTPTTNPRPPIDDSYMDAPFVNRPPTNKPPIDDSYMDFPPKPATGGTPGQVNTGNPVIVQTGPGPVLSTVATADANKPQLAPGQTTTTVSVVAPTGGTSTGSVTTAQPPIVVTSQPTVTSSVANAQGPQTVTQSNQVIQVSGPGNPTIVTQGVAQPQPIDNRPVVVSAVPQVPAVNGPQNNAPALQALNVPTVVATNPTAVAVPSLPVLVSNPPANVPQPPPAQQPPVVAQLQPPLPVVSGPQNNAPALQAANPPTVINQPTVGAVPSLPVVVNSPAVVPQPPAQQPGPAIVQAVPQVPVVTGPQNNLPALQAPNSPTVVATQPVAVAVPSLPVVVNNPAVIPQPPAQQPGPVFVQAVPQVPLVGGPQNNAPALQAPNTPTVINQPTAVAIPSLPVVVNNPAVVPQPPAQQPGPVIVQAVPQVPLVGSPQNNLPALQTPNTPTVVATNPTAVAVPSLPVVVNNSAVIPQPPAQQPGPVIVQAVPQVPLVSGPQNNAPALQAPNTPTVINQPTAVAIPSLPVVVNNPAVVPQPPAQQPGPVIVQAVPQVPLVGSPQNNLPALQTPNTPTVVATNPTAVAVPSLPVVVNNSAVIPQPPAQQPGPVIVQAVPQVPVVSGPQNNSPALQAANTQTVINQPTAVAVPSLPVVVNNSAVIPQPPAQQPGPVIVQAVPQVPVVSGPQNNSPALQAANTPTVINQPMVVAVPSLPVVVSDPPANVAQPPPAQQPPVMAQLQPPLPVVTGPQNNLPALQAPNSPTVVATQPVAVAEPSLPVAVNNPPNIPQPPAQQPSPVIVQAEPTLPIVGGPQNNVPALQAPNTPTVINQPTVVAVPSLPIVVNNPAVVPQPPAQQPSPVIVQAEPTLPIVGGPQNNAPALQAPNTPTVINQPTVAAVPSLPVVVSNPAVIPQPPAQAPGTVTLQPVPQVPVVDPQPGHPGALQAPSTTTTVTQPVVIAVPPIPTQSGPVLTAVPVPGPQSQQSPTVVVAPDTPPLTFVTTSPHQGPANPGGQPITGPSTQPQTPGPLGRPPGGGGPTLAGSVNVTPDNGQPPRPTDQPTTVGGPGGQEQPVVAGVRPRVLPFTLPAAGESELFGLHYSVIYRNYEAQTLVNDIGRPLYALTSGYELFLLLEGRHRLPQTPAATPRR